MNLWQDFSTNQGKLIHKWMHYFPIYEKHLAGWRNKTLTFWEIGVSKGGSLQMWQRFFGPMATIVGLDIDPACYEHEGINVHVRIGDQSDVRFLQSVIDEFGMPDVVIDDGSHQMEHLRKTFEFLYKKLPKNGIYIAEDLHTAYWEEYGGGLYEPNTFINLSKGFIDQLNADHSRGAVLPNFITRHTLGISFYDSVVVLERGSIPSKFSTVQSGNNSIRKTGELLPPAVTLSARWLPETTGNVAEKSDFRSISFIICSVDNRKFDYISGRLAEICSTPFEIIRISDAKSLSEGYNRGIEKACHDIVVLCHDDIDLLCADIVPVLSNAFNEFDVVGVAGARTLRSAFWPHGRDLDDSAGLVIHGPAGEHSGTFVINAFGISNQRLLPVQALDGVFIAAKRSVLDSVRFDADAFDGFHLYDIDFTYRCHRQGFRVGICKDLMVVHSSHGNFGEDWRAYENRLLLKFPELERAVLQSTSEVVAIPAASVQEARGLVLQLLNEGAAAIPSASSDRLRANRRYQLWRKRTSFQEIDAQLLAERMVLKWSHRPGLHLLMSLLPGQEGMLADTLDSLGQQIYGEWMLTIATTLEIPAGLADVPRVQWLTLRDPHNTALVIDEIAAASAGAWCAWITPGLTLESHALQVTADYANAFPEWRLMYCDGDVRQADGSFTDPQFRPGIDVDLLRSQNYLGSLVLVQKQAFLHAGRFGSIRGAETYDLALRVLDSYGERAVGHISQVLAHQSTGSEAKNCTQAEKAAVQEHMQRRGVLADVLEGLKPGLRRLRYQSQAQPFVSIIIQTRDREEYLRPLLESVLELTRYPSYEVLVIDNGSTDIDACRFLKAWPDSPGWAGRAQVIAAPGKFNFSAACNAGAANAKGEFLLFLDSDMHVTQPDWLDLLVGIAQRPDVGAVGPRLNYPGSAKVQQAGWIAGLTGTAASPWVNQLGPEDLGYMGRAQCDQSVRAVSGSALMVRRSIYENLAGFDAQDLPLFHGALDLCMRIGAAGHKIVWTPHAMLAHYDGVSMRARQAKQIAMLEDTVEGERAKDIILKRWMPRLADDPGYNRNLSLMEAYQPEHVAFIDWDPSFQDRQRILGIPVHGAAGEYRIRAPLRTIGKAGLAQTMACEEPQAFKVRLLQPVEIARASPNAIVFHQPIGDAQMDALESYARYFPDITRIVTIDDLITDIPKKSSAHKNSFKDARSRLRRLLSAADRLVVSTQPLADYFEDMIGEIRVVPNSLEGELWSAVTPAKTARSKPRVGWAGAQQHQGDLELVYAVVKELADEVDWVFLGMCPPTLRAFVHESIDFQQDFRLYPQTLASMDLDLAIAPLEVNAFNEAKSNLRLLEYGAMGWPVICTDIYPYYGAPVTRLPNKPELWISTIREQLAEPDALRRGGQALQQWVQQGFLLEDHAAAWFAAYGA